MILSSLDSNDLISALKANIKAKISYLQRQLKSMEVIDQSSILIVNSNEMTDMLNLVCCQENTNYDWWIFNLCFNRD